MRSLTASIVAGAALMACSGDHDWLAQRNVDAEAPVDVAHVADVADVRGGDRRRDVPPADVGEASLDDRVDAVEPPEPPGHWTFTLTNGLVDAESARFCFVPVDEDRERPEQVVPEPPGGLAFGKSLVLSELRGIDPSTMGIHIYAVLGGPSADAGMECKALLDAQGVADDGATRGSIAVSLPIVPVGTLAEERSYLGVVTGCASRWPYDDADAGDDAGNDGAAPDGADASPVDAPAADVFRRPDRAAICAGSSRAPNAGLVLVRLSRRDVAARFGLQAVHASAAVAAARITVERTGGSAPIFSADLGPYQIVPRDGLTAVTREEFGPSIGAATLRVASPVSAFPSATLSLGSALAASGIDEAALMEGDLLSLVLIGAQPGQTPIRPWNAARLVVVRNDPLRGGN